MYPHPCTHCGLCCIAKVCPIGQTLMRLSTSQGTCPALEWDSSNPDESRCGLITRPDHYLSPAALRSVRDHSMPLATALGSGAGCCIAARVIVGGVTHDFAALPPETKTNLVRIQRGLQPLHSPDSSDSRCLTSSSSPSTINSQPSTI